MWFKILLNVVTLGIPAIIRAIAEARRKRREQEAKLAKEAKKENKNEK